VAGTLVGVVARVRCRQFLAFVRFPQTRIEHQVRERLRERS
jgi:hypothetical protein